MSVRDLCTIFSDMEQNVEDCLFQEAEDVDISLCKILEMLEQEDSNLDSNFDYTE